MYYHRRLAGMWRWSGGLGAPALAAIKSEVTWDLIFSMLKIKWFNKSYKIKFKIRIKLRKYLTHNLKCFKFKKYFRNY